jgi:hypothetical protein
MANIKNLDDYLKNDPAVKSAKTKLDKASADLARETAAKNAVKEGTPSYADVMTRYNKALDASNTAKSNFDAVSRKATEYFNTNKDSILAETKASEAKTDRQRLIDAKSDRDRLKKAGQSTTVLDQKIKDLEDKIAGTGKYAPAGPTGPTEDMGATGATGAMGGSGNIPIEEFLRNLDAAGASTINEIKAYLGIKNLDGKLDYATITAIYGKEKEIETVADATGRPVDRLTYYKSAPKTGGEGVVPTATISSPTSASALINSVFQTELKRDATPAEIEKYTLELNAAERKNPSKTVKGITTGGLNKTEFLTQVVKKLPEYSTKKSEKSSLTSQSILGTARANGLNLAQDQINSFVKQVEDGKDLKVIENQIRSIAANGMPENVKKLLNEGIDLETIYAPYKSTMAATLELSPEAISLNDPILRSALGPEKEMTMYDFQKALRKDARWQYTNNAKEDVFQSVNKVLQDFGFQG